jgi:sugar (pentulose or hexulose) kinase
MASQFKQLSGIDVWAMLPQVLSAGEYVGVLSEAGALLLDPSGTLKSGIPMCPPEGDAGTGMVATNSVGKLTGNISAGTSIFAMTVLDKEISAYYPEVDIVMTPGGMPVAMIHCNNCTTDIDAWVGLFGEALETMGVIPDKDELYTKLYLKALEADPDCGGLFNCNYYSGEHLTGFEEGRPLFTRSPDSRFNLANFMRTQLSSAMATLKLGMGILTEKESIKPELFYGHGGLFKTSGVAQNLMASALGIPVVVMDSAGEGGAWGIALLAAYRAYRAHLSAGSAAGAGSKQADVTVDTFVQGELSLDQDELSLGQSELSLEQFLDAVFMQTQSVRAEPDSNDSEGFDAFMRRYTAGLEIERAAVKYLDQ